MIIPLPGKWSSSSGRWLVCDRLYDIRNRKPTVSCRVRLRYLKTLRENMGEYRPVSPPVSAGSRREAARCP